MLHTTQLFHSPAALILTLWLFFACGEEVPLGSLGRIIIYLMCGVMFLSDIGGIRKNPTTNKKRCAAANTDLLVIPVVLIPLQLILQWLLFPSVVIRIVIWSGALALLVCKDGRDGISFGKAIWGLQVVDEYGAPVSMKKNLWRSVFFLMGLVDAWTLWHRTYRWSDRWVGVSVVPFQQPFSRWVKHFPFWLPLLVWLLAGLFVGLVYELIKT